MIRTRPTWGIIASMRRRCSLLPALALLGCTAGSNNDDAKACSTIEIELLSMQLRHAEPHEQARIVSEKLDPLCEWTSLIVYGDHDPGLTIDGQALFARVCPREPTIVETPLTPAQLYDHCDFARLGIVERDEYRLRARADPLAWLLYQWLIENGASEEQARVIARAQLRTELDVWARIPGLRLPTIAAELPLWDAPIVQVSASELVFHGKSLVSRDGGALDGEGLILPLYDELELEVERARQIAEAIGNEWSGELMIAADPRTPFATFERVAYTAELAGYRRMGLIVEPQPFDYRVIPLALAPSDGLTLDVTVYSDKSRVRIDPSPPPAVCDGDPKPQVILRGTADINYARLLDVVDQHRACELALKLPTPG